MGKHLTWSDRLTIERMLLKHYRVKEIADAIGCSERTIYYEIKRSTYKHTDGRYLTEEERYNPDGAQRRYEEMLKRKGAKAKITLDDEYRKDIAELIKNKKYSPQAAMLSVNGNGKEYKVKITSVNTIYKAIRNGKIEDVKMRDCPMRGKRKKKVQKVARQKRPTKGTSIEKRSKSVLKRNQFGHWEMDTVLGGQGSKAVLLVLTERKTRYELILRLHRLTVNEVMMALDTIKVKYGDSFDGVFKDVTCDNGKEFVASELEKIFKEVYFAHPQSPFERGSNENQNRMIRRYYPKGTSFDDATDDDIAFVEEWMNDYPRPMFDGETSRQRYDIEISIIGYP